LQTAYQIFLGTGLQQQAKSQKGIRMELLTSQLVRRSMTHQKLLPLLYQPQQMPRATQLQLDFSNSDKHGFLGQSEFCPQN